MPLLQTSKMPFAVLLESIIQIEVKKTMLKRCSKKFKRHMLFSLMNKSGHNTTDLDTMGQEVDLHLVDLVVEDLISILKTCSAVIFFLISLVEEAEVVDAVPVGVVAIFGCFIQWT